MTPRELKALDHRLTAFLEDLLAPLGRKERRHWARVYVQGLLLDGERKSIEPMASRIPEADVQALRQFVGQSPWAVDVVQQQLARKVVDLLSEPEVWILDETSFPKADEHSVGVARQYCGALGKVANCQVAVTLHWSSAEASCPLSWRLYLPKAWIENAERAQEVKLPKDLSYRSQAELALELIDQMLSWEVPRLPVVADSAYGNSFEFREQLRRRQLFYVMAVEATTVVWTEDPNAIPVPPSAPTGRPRRYPPLNSMPTPQDLASVARQKVKWRAGSRGPQRSRCAQLKVWAAHKWRAQEHPERVAEWLLIEWPEGESAPTKYWLAQLGTSRPGRRRLLRLAHARWRIEMDYRELKDELGLDQFEGRHWLGWHHHVTLVTLAYAFLRSEQARLKKNFWCDLAPSEEGTTTAAD
jgi:SRSO17 transposase